MADNHCSQQRAVHHFGSAQHPPYLNLLGQGAEKRVALRRRPLPGPLCTLAAPACRAAPGGSRCLLALLLGRQLGQLPVPPIVLEQLLQLREVVWSGDDILAGG